MTPASTTTSSSWGTSHSCTNTPWLESGIVLWKKMEGILKSDSHIRKSRALGERRCTVKKKTAVLTPSRNVLFKRKWLFTRPLNFKWIEAFFYVRWVLPNINVCLSLPERWSLQCKCMWVNWRNLSKMFVKIGIHDGQRKTIFFILSILIVYSWFRVVLKLRYTDFGNFRPLSHQGIGTPRYPLGLLPHGLTLRLWKQKWTDWFFRRTDLSHP